MPLRLELGTSFNMRLTATCSRSAENLAVAGALQTTSNLTQKSQIPVSIDWLACVLKRLIVFALFLYHNIYIPCISRYVYLSFGISRTSLMHVYSRCAFPRAVAEALHIRQEPRDEQRSFLILSAFHLQRSQESLL